MGPVGSAYDNALAESFIATLKTEVLYRSSWPTRQVVRTAIFEYIGGSYNTRRRHSTLGHLSPAEFEKAKLREEDGCVTETCLPNRGKSTPYLPFRLCVGPSSLREQRS